MSRLFATFFFVGYLRPASGTWGSLAALPFIWALHEIGQRFVPLELGGPLLLAVALVVTYFGGLAATRIITSEGGDHDPSEIVIDEVVGQGIAILPVSIGAAGVGADMLALWPGWVVGFLAFRLFDIWKPWLVGRVDRRNDPVGVMLDDVIAGVFAALTVLAAAALSHLAIMV
ncbi:phosphatidylglycerophosphatase A [Maritimibacter sp. UBA3975]|uniref:phosphatidylglycerophosphatase A family protein n=1 Tax=Maritimibacter sp. UBA3975 TaxID=1946833 RepID=UPI000C0B8823|nr:phosphatidylglycerophosphatase A [Maritimibacter sp. UBA3975]MAM60173.1 phosphatidylglycerophosphatase A [Maritimibacter sp.]|tara:strand:- start:6085 stop:6603 length:519 start_codon:yes stop_codon:yes gene_type:complete